MFRPNANCIINKASETTDIYGMPLPGITVKERCAVVKLNVKNEKTNVRSHTSASRGNAQEYEDDAIFLMTKKSVVAIDDLISVSGFKFRVSSVFPRYDLLGNLDHYQISCSYWNA